MKRIDTAGRAIDLFGAGKPGFKEGNPATDDPPTIVDASWPNHVQEEIARAIEGLGIALDGAKYDQLLTALKRGGLVSALVTFDADAALDDANIGKLHIYTGAGGHTFGWTNNAKPGLNFEIVNLGAGNLTLEPDGAEEIDGVASIVLGAGQSVRVRRISDTDAIVTAARGYGGGSAARTRLTAAAAIGAIGDAHRNALIDYDTTAGAIAQSLPDPAAFGAGQSIWLRRAAGANTLTVSVSGGAVLRLPTGTTMTSVVLRNRGELVELMSDGVDWSVLSLKKEGPDCRAYLTAGQSLTINVFTRIQGFTIITDPDGVFATATGRITPNVPGRYLLFACVKIDGSIPDQNQFTFEFWKNGSSLARGFSVSTSGNNTVSTVGTVVDFAAPGDYYEIYGWSPSFSMQCQAGQTYFGATRIG